MDNAIKLVCHEILRVCDCARTTSTKVLTANNPLVSLSITDFRVDKLVRMWTGYADQGEWDNVTNYAVNDMVQGDGNPDALFYRCKVAHGPGVAAPHDAAAEPPNSTYWEQVSWGGGFNVELKDINYVSKRLDEYVETGRPECIAFINNTTGYVWPVPDLAYTLNLLWKSPLESWTSGEASVTINIPDEYVHPAIWFGAVAALKHSDANVRNDSFPWQRFQEFLQNIAGSSGFETNVLMRDEADYT